MNKFDWKWILILLIGSLGIFGSVMKFIDYKKTPVVIGQNDVAVYDSLKTVLAYKKDKTTWVILNEQKTVRVLELEIYRLSSLLNQAEKINQRVKHQYDSVLLLHKK